MAHIIPEETSYGHKIKMGSNGVYTWIVVDNIDFSDAVSCSFSQDTYKNCDLPLVTLTVPISKLEGMSYAEFKDKFKRKDS